MKKTLNVAVIGGGFMGKAHSNAWSKVTKFFDTGCEINLKVLVGNKAPVEKLATTWGYDEVSYDWKSVVNRDDIDIVDIVTPTFMHKEMVIGAAKAGKAIFCEKPFTLTYTDALEALQAVKEAGVFHYLNHNYRRVPAVALAKQLVDEGRLGTIYHWRGAYLQDWIMDPNYPVSWHLKKECAGGGPLYDLSSHALDLARFIIGEPTAVTAVNRTFIKERPAAGTGAAAFTAGTGVDKSRMLPVTVEDASFAIVEFENGALGSIESSRFAQGRKNHNDFEIYGSKGAIHFNFERMNELQFLDATEPLREQGYRTILATENVHPYESAWWPSGHIVGYEHTFVNAFADCLKALMSGESVTPNFEDGVRIIRLLQAIQLSDREHRRVTVDEIQ